MENKRKRDENDSDLNSPEPKLTRIDSDNSAESTLRNSENSDWNSPETHLSEEDLLNILDDSDIVTDRDPAIQGLDSVIKSFEEEIMVQAPAPAAAPAVFIDQASDSGESQPELGYLLEASDDELGLPPTTSSGEEVKIEAVNFEASSADPEAVGLDGNLLGFENEIPSYDSFEFGIVVDSESNLNDNNSEFVALGGLFDYSDQSYDPAGDSELLWRPESLPAL
ncbi:hypothetical protein ACB098_04G079600 [Castanea mollissima]|uniref:Uncharacterized protein n=1 Tax=Castanea mollissima TaxID=60419 RepID=A0A8J4QEE1_9ROSI|nr:hypothetical protein CMV_028634 [Castanea mollissima]